MKLKSRFITQSLSVLLGTLVVTVCLSVLFIYIYEQLGGISVVNSTNNVHIAAVRENEIIQNDTPFTTVQIKSAYMSARLGERAFENSGTRYNVSIVPMELADGKTYDLITFAAEINYKNFYTVLILFIAAVFVISFVVANIITIKNNKRNIIFPIINLKRETELLSDGELDAEVVDEGAGEVRSLCAAVETLRLRLKESVYENKKFEDNRKFLISSISHDLKTPVTAVRGYIEGVLDGVAKSPEKQREYLEKAISKTDTINIMIDDLLLYSKLDLNQLPFDLQKIDICEFMKSAVEDNSFDFDKQNKKIIFEPETEKVGVMIDPSRFKRVVQNILDNAKKHTDSDAGTVFVRVRQTEAAVITEIADNGCGVSEEDLPHIFERFYRGDASRKVEGSSGLGLAIAKLVVENCGGRIWAVNRHGGGLSIMISLRRVDL